MTSSHLTENPDGICAGLIEKNNAAYLIFDIEKRFKIYYYFILFILF
jgi:hypothetical protein